MGYKISGFVCVMGQIKGIYELNHIRINPIGRALRQKDRQYEIKYWLLNEMINIMNNQHILDGLFKVRF